MLSARCHAPNPEYLSQRLNGSGESEVFFNFLCMVEFDQPALSLVKIQTTQYGCNSDIHDDRLAAPFWIGVHSSGLALFSPSPVTDEMIGDQFNVPRDPARKMQPSYLCAGAPITVTKYNLLRRFRFTFTVKDAHLTEDKSPKMFRR